MRHPNLACDFLFTIVYILGGDLSELHARLQGQIGLRRRRPRTSQSLRAYLQLRMPALFGASCAGWVLCKKVL